MITPALVDTGASISVVSEELARQIFTKEGRPYLLTRVETSVTSATGHGLHILGQMETKVSGVGVVSFLVIRNLSNHQCIIGWDLLHKFGVELSENRLTWGGETYELTPYSVPESYNIEVDGLTRVVRKYRSVFGQPDRLKEAKVPPMEIITNGAPIHQRPYRTPLVKREAIDKEIDKMLEMGIIRKSTSPWGSPVLLVPKKDGELRFCVDYRRLNDITVKNRYPLPFIQDVFDQLGGAKIFSTLDLRSGYHQVGLTEKSIEKTAFVCHRGQFEYVRVPFGLTNAPGHFQSVMNHVLAKHIGKRVMVFLDDVVIYSKDASQHAADVELVLKDLQAANLTLKESKCHFGKTELDLLGYMISADGIRAQPSKTEAIKQLSSPTNVSELRRFLGMSSYYRQLVPHFADIAEPLFQLTRKGIEWNWSNEAESAFNTLKDSLCSNKVMAHPDPSKPYILYTDACDHAIGGILCQEDENGIERPIQYLSAQLTSTQRRWATVEKECWAVVYCLDKLRCYLLGSQFVVFTDHKPLLSLFTNQMKNTKIQRWGILFEEFGAVIKYRPGANNVRADMLSRIVTHEAAVIDMSSEWIQLDSGKCSEFHLYDDIDQNLLIRDQAVEFQSEIVSAHEPDSNYVMHNGILYSCYRTNRYEPRYPRIVLPSSFRRQVIERCHIEAAHSGLIKTMVMVQEGYVWPGMRKEIERYVKKCPICKVHIAQPEKVQMGDMPLAQTPGQIVGLDLIGPLMASHMGSTYLMVVIDHFSGWVEAYPLRNKSNESVWDKFRTEYIPRHGCCRVLITDNGAEFRGKDWEEWLRGNRIEHRRTTPYHPQANGKTERANRTIKTMLRKLINGERSNWEDKLGPALWAIRTTTSATTGFSPFFLHYARQPRVPISDMLSPNSEYTFANRLAMQSEIFREAAHATKDSRKSNKERLDKKANAKEIKVGDHVILKANEPLSLTAKWDYGYLVTKVNGLVIDLMHPESGATLRVNREKVVVTDSDIAWEEVSPRPRRQRQRVKQVHVPKRRDTTRNRRDSSADSCISNHSNTSTASKRSSGANGAGNKTQQPVPVFKAPTALPPLSRNRSVKRQLSDDSDTEEYQDTPTERATESKRLAGADGAGTSSTQPAPAPQAPSSPQPFRPHGSVKRQHSNDGQPDALQDTIAKRTRSQSTAGIKRTVDTDSCDPDPKRWRPEQVSLLAYVWEYFSTLPRLTSV